MDYVFRHCGALHWLVERSTGNGSSTTHPFFTVYRNSGNTELPPMAPLQDQLSCFFTAVTPQADRFCQYIRQEVDSSINKGRGGPPTFRTHGELCHRLGSLQATGPSLRIRNSTSIIRARPSNTGYNGMQHSTQSSWGICKPSP